jgi:membrane fusion protein (multidrug efflux system)
MKNIDKAVSYLKRILIFIKIIGLKIFSILKLNKAWTKFKILKLTYKIAIGLLVAALLIAYKFLFGPGWTEDIKMVEVHKVSKGNLLVTTRLLGTIGAKKYFLAIASENGILDFVATSGARLKQGEIIARINKPEIQKAYDGSLEAVKIANDRYQREVNLEKTKASSKHAVEERYSGLVEAQLRLAAAKERLDKILFIAPFDGVVGSALLYPGSKVIDGAEIVTFYDPDDLVVKFDIPSNLLGYLGTEAKVTINEKEYKTAFIQRALSVGSYTVPAYVDFQRTNSIIGEITDVDLHMVDKSDIITVPSSCVFIRNGETMVYTVTDNKAHLESVKTGVKEKNVVEILEGLKPGDLVVSQGQTRLYPEINVKIHEDSL